MSTALGEVGLVGIEVVEHFGYSAPVMADLDSIKNKIDRPEPIDENLYELPSDEAAAIPTVPRPWRIIVVSTLHTNPVEICCIVAISMECSCSSQHLK